MESKGGPNFCHSFGGNYRLNKNKYQIFIDYSNCKMVYWSEPLTAALAVPGSIPIGVLTFSLRPIKSGRKSVPNFCHRLESFESMTEISFFLTFRVETLKKATLPKFLPLTRKWPEFLSFICWRKLLLISI
jgi:hypothetical protein